MFSFVLFFFFFFSQFSLQNNIRRIKFSWYSYSIVYIYTYTVIIHIYVKGICTYSHWKKYNTYIYLDIYLVYRGKMRGEARGVFRHSCRRICNRLYSFWHTPIQTPQPDSTTLHSWMFDFFFLLLLSLCFLYFLSPFTHFHSFFRRKFLWFLFFLMRNILSVSAKCFLLY